MSDQEDIQVIRENPGQANPLKHEDVVLISSDSNNVRV